jgi:hypothetical protein
LKEAILAALDRVGGVDYLARLAVENSSAFSSLLGKVLPSTLDVSDSSGGNATIRFERVIVQAEPRQLEHRPAASHTLPRGDVIDAEPSDSKDLD